MFRRARPSRPIKHLRGKQEKPLFLPHRPTREKFRQQTSIKKQLRCETGGRRFIMLADSGMKDVRKKRGELRCKLLSASGPKLATSLQGYADRPNLAALAVLRKLGLLRSTTGCHLNQYPRQMT